jgi:long-subunit fatty acid transport protein
MKNMTLIVALSLLSVQIAGANGTSGASFLKMGAGARAAAMGESVVSNTNDATATYWNPAGLAQVEEVQISAMQNTHLVDTDYQHVAAVKPLGRLGLGLSLARMNYGSIDRYNNSNVKDGDFQATSLAVGLSLGAKISDDISLGGTLKMIRESIENEGASGVAADMGFLYNVNGYTWGAAIQNVGPALKMVKDADALPMTIRLGGSTRVLDKKMLLSAGVSKANDSDANLQAGVEYGLLPFFTLRGGYKLVSGASDLGGLVGVSGGFGVQFNRFNLDYAVTPFGDLGMSHRISLLVRFASSSPSSY